MGNIQKRKRKSRRERAALPPYASLIGGASGGVLALGLALLFLPQWAVSIAPASAFAVYLGLSLYELPCLKPEFLRRRAADSDAPAVVIFSAVVMVIAVAFFALFIALNEHSPDRIGIGISIASVLLGWFGINTMAGLHYAYEYYEVPATAAAGEGVVGGLAFPPGDEPDGWAFVYFAFVIGMTAQVADVDVTSSAMRKRVLLHGVFSFLFNTVILAATVNAVVALAGGG